MQYEKMEFVDAVADLAQRAGMELPREAQVPHEAGGADLHDLLNQAARFFTQNLADQARGRDYLKVRGIDSATQNRFALGFATDSWDALLKRFGTDEDTRRRLLQVGMIIERDTRGGERVAGFYDRFRDRLMFPIRDSRGRVIAFGGRIIDQGEPKYLNSPETPLFHKGRELYGLYEARQARSDFKRLMIVEGYMDVVRLHQAGITYAVATLGTATTQEHLHKIFRITSELVFCFDGDRAGRQAAWRALENALPLAQDGREFKFMFLPDGHDPDSLIAAEGPEAFEGRSKAAMPLSEFMLQRLTVEVDLQHIDGRAKLKALVAPLFARMPEGIYRELLAEQLAARVGIPAKSLKESFAATGAQASGTRGEPRTASQSQSNTQRASTSRASAGRGSSGRGSLLSQSITLVLHYPSAAGAVRNLDVLAEVDKPGVSVLRELLDQAIAMTEPSTAMLLERWRERAEYGRLSELATAQPLVADLPSATRELDMAVQKLLEACGPAHRMNELLEKAQDTGLNYEEKAELSSLLQAKGRPRAPH